MIMNAKNFWNKKYGGKVSENEAVKNTEYEDVFETMNEFAKINFSFSESDFLAAYTLGYNTAKDGRPQEAANILSAFKRGHDIFKNINWDNED